MVEKARAHGGGPRAMRSTGPMQLAHRQVEIVRMRQRQEKPGQGWPTPADGRTTAVSAQCDAGAARGYLRVEIGPCLGSPADHERRHELFGRHLFGEIERDQPRPAPLPRSGCAGERALLERLEALANDRRLERTLQPPQ